MRVVHWNTHHGGKRTDGVLDVKGLTAWLVKFAPDVVSLNELEQFDGYGNIDQLETHRAALEIAQRTPWYAAFVQMTGGSTNKGIGNGLLSKQPLMSVNRKGLFGGRSVLSCVQPFGVVYTTHSDPNSAQKRNIELTQILLWQTPLPVIVCGDFNATPTSVEVAPWPTLFKDAWVEAKKLGTATAFTGDGITHGSHRIDYVWYRGLTISSVDVPDTRNAAGVFPSDHHPVIATFK